MAGGGDINPRAFPPAMLCLGHQVLGESLGVFDRRADATAATPTLLQAIPGQRLAATHGRHGPTGPRKSPPEERRVAGLGPPRHGRPDAGGGDGKDRTALLQTPAATQAWLCERGRWSTAKRSAPWKGVGKQGGTLLVALLSPRCGRGSIREQTVICGRGQGEADRAVSLFGRMRSRGQACRDVRRWG
jgi:hypothetical protein